MFSAAQNQRPGFLSGAFQMDSLLNGCGSKVTRPFPVVELLCLSVLILITVFRRKLSSNDQYRRETSKPPLHIAVSKSGMAPFIVSLIKGKDEKSSPSKLQSSVDAAICLERISLDDNILLNILVYLSDVDIGKLSLTSRSLSGNCTSDFVWEQLWIMTYGAMWNDSNVVKIREIRGITWNPTVRIQECALKDSNYRAGDGLLMKKCPRPSQGWLVFYKEFEFCWMDWLLAGCCTQGYCLIGLYGSVYDITNFLPEHPGSSESLTEAAGGDGTDIFSDIGHSSFASTLADMFILWGVGRKKKQEQEESARTPSLQKQYVQLRPSRFQVRMKRDRYFAERLILRDNSLVRNTMSFCRNKSEQTLSLEDIRGSGHENEIDGNRGDEEGEGDNSDIEIETMSDSDGTINDDLIPSNNNNPILIDNDNVALITGAVTNTIAGDSWPLRLKINLDISSNITAGIEHITSSLSLPISVLSIRESIHLANVRASNFLRRGIVRNKLRDRTGMKSMAPILFKSHECRSGRKHSGKLRMFYNPVDLQWWGWWTCCGLGELSVDKKEEESMYLQISEKNISYKMC